MKKKSGPPILPMHPAGSVFPFASKQVTTWRPPSRSRPRRRVEKHRNDCKEVTGAESHLPLRSFLSISAPPPLSSDICVYRILPIVLLFLHSESTDYFTPLLVGLKGNAA